MRAAKPYKHYSYMASSETALTPARAAVARAVSPLADKIKGGR